MNWNKYIISCILLLLVTSCSINYGFSGGSINYDYTRTIRIADFPNRTAFYSPMSAMFTQALRRRFVEQTRLTETTSNADIEIEGEINRFDVQGVAVKSDAFSSQTRLTISVRVQYINNREASKDIDQTFSASQEFPSTSSIDEVQDRLVKIIIDELVDMIYNATVANW